jgi:hypothetical protein
MGNNRFHIQSVDRSETTVMVTVCNYRYGMAVENDDGTFSGVASSFSHDTGITPLLVRLEPPPERLPHLSAEPWVAREVVKPLVPN